jgi:hypothetical protein
VTGEVSPAGQPGDGRPELRASHADRDRVVEQLRVAAGDGRLTAEELDERLEVALTARTYRELAVLTADLPPAGVNSAAVRKPKDVLRMEHRGGNAYQVGRWVVPKRIEAKVTGGNIKLDFTEAVITDRVLQVEADVRGGNAYQVGRWVVPKRIEAKVTGGNIKLDFTEAVITDRVLQVEADVRGGNMIIVTRPGVVVDTSEVSMIGGNVHNRPIWPDAPVDLTVEVAGQLKGGNIRVRGPRRTFWQWLRRQPRRRG